MSRSTAALIAQIGNIGIAALSFWLSFVALADLARRSGFAEPQALAWPLIVDGLIVVSTAAAMAMPRAVYPWALLVLGAAVSLAGNGIHAWELTRSPVAVCVSLVPPLWLLASTHLTVRLMHRTAVESSTADEECSEPDVETEANGEDRRTRALRLLAEGELSQRAIAAEIGVSDTTIGKWRKAAAAVGQSNDSADSLKRSVQFV
ncbi:DUF2637 domain-containing protein [Rhodococcus sp. Eu-32]|uniref:DUF2637 domain-containing protein n=1 Tax=Rhodococcus sp. Eu-32 TaxID=1017319 RepID=UPI000DF128FA|nr:DUF2637 domain-containing protein [Rhodococcus sp. Eu-32]RRQ26336.1 DUF2637 domain-containing protein [Rhodococcus sp. Eu-32]